VKCVLIERAIDIDTRAPKLRTNSHKTSYHPCAQINIQYLWNWKWYFFSSKNNSLLAGQQRNVCDIAATLLIHAIRDYICMAYTSLLYCICIQEWSRLEIIKRQIGRPKTDGLEGRLSKLLQDDIGWSKWFLYSNCHPWKQFTDRQTDPVRTAYEGRLFNLFWNMTMV
jgi:hypothetical protein